MLDWSLTIALVRIFHESKLFLRPVMSILSIFLVPFSKVRSMLLYAVFLRFVVINQKQKNSIWEKSDDFAGISLNRMHFIPDSFFVKWASVDLDVWQEALPVWSSTLSMSFACTRHQFLLQNLFRKRSLIVEEINFGFTWNSFYF